MKKIIALSLSGLFLFYSCEKDTETGEKLFISFEVSGDKIVLEEGNDYYDDFFFSRGNLYLEIGGGLENDDYVLNNYSSTILNSFFISFHNIQFEDLVEGIYNYEGSIYGNDTLNSGVEITWMTSEKWFNLIKNYKQSDAYIQCVESNGDNGPMICSNNLRSSSDFYSTNNFKDQSRGHFRITKTSLKKFKQQCFCEEEGVLVDDLIIEGTFNCITVSSLDTADKKNISGNFRIHIPSPLRFDCPDQCLNY